MLLHAIDGEQSRLIAQAQGPKQYTMDELGNLVQQRFGVSRSWRPNLHFRRAEEIRRLPEQRAALDAWALGERMTVETYLTRWAKLTFGG